MVKEWKIVVGANYGDEGKGLATRYFTLKALREGRKVLNVLYNGGCQRGHTADFPDGTRHVFHHFGAGTLDGADTYFASQFIVNPMEFMREGAEIEARLGRFPTCLISPYCRVSTPYDMFINRIVEDSRGRHRHGSCGYGIWETVCRTNEMTRSGKWPEPVYAVMADMTDTDLMDMLFWISSVYVPKKLLEYDVVNVPNEYRELMSSYTLARNYVTDFRAMTQLCSTMKRFPEYDTYIYEGGQGLALSEHNLTEFPNVTPSDTGAVHARLDIASKVRLFGLDPIDGNLEICYVTRPYYTRHGAGKLPGERRPEEFIPDWTEDLTNTPNPYQGELRYAPIDKAVWRRIRTDLRINNGDGAARMSLFLTHMNEADDRWLQSVEGKGYNVYCSSEKYAEDMLGDGDEGQSSTDD